MQDAVEEQLIALTVGRQLTPTQGKQGLPSCLTTLNLNPKRLV